MAQLMIEEEEIKIAKWYRIRVSFSRLIDLQKYLGFLADEMGFEESQISVVRDAPLGLFIVDIHSDLNDPFTVITQHVVMHYMGIKCLSMTGVYT